MANFDVQTSEIGVHLKKLVAGQIDQVTFLGRDLTEVEIITDGAADIFVRFGGQDPAVGSGSCWRVPPAMGSTVIPVNTSKDTVVRLISAGTPVYSVSRTA